MRWMCQRGRVTHDEHGTRLAARFHHDDSMTIAAANGGLAHRDSVAHGHRFERRLHAVTDHVWCMVGNGLSNQTFVAAPDGLIVIDTGESNEEMAAALEAVRAHTIDAAFSIRAEDRLGSIEPGKYADFTIIDGNPILALSAPRMIT